VWVCGDARATMKMIDNITSRKTATHRVHRIDTKGRFGFLKVLWMVLKLLRRHSHLQRYSTDGEGFYRSSTERIPEQVIDNTICGVSFAKPDDLDAQLVHFMYTYWNLITGQRNNRVSLFSCPVLKIGKFRGVLLETHIMFDGT
jgi:hypothetical protein